MPKPLHNHGPSAPPHEHPHERCCHEPTHGEMMELIERRFDDIMEELRKRSR